MQACSDEIIEFKKLQQRFPDQFKSVFPDRMAAKTVVIIPSLSLDQEILAKIDGIIHYEERLLCLLMLLRMPNTHVIYVTSIPVHNIIMDYYLHLLPGITGYHARQRLKTLSCFDASAKSLTQKILERPRLIERIRKSIPPDHVAHIACFNVTEAERSLAVQLHMPIYGCDPDLNYLGTKSFSRKIFKECNVGTPPGFEDCNNEEDIIEALFKLKLMLPGLNRAVIKLNDGFSGDGNAVFSYEGSPGKEYLKLWIAEVLRQRLQMVAHDLVYESYLKKFTEAGGIVEVFIEGEQKVFPSVQCRITPLGETEVISTHDQVIGGESGHVFLGAHFPAGKEYAVAIAELGKKIADKLKSYGVLGRFSIDFISVKENNEWKHYALEINLRKGGTTHPYLMLQYLTDGTYDASKAIYLTASAQTRYYFFSDNLQSEYYKGLTPHDLIEITTANDLLYDGSIQQGVMFHMIGALSQYGKLGILCIGATPAITMHLFNKTVEVLNKEKHNKRVCCTSS
ncbi:carboxylate-amine ligase [Ginsengibacter hankyongi]|uniref:Carboxylate-amine ligase n=1 Tax=Ginsengibacter hankyongi TaxID=2607284 RepID=A0A5J5IE75_9BACT|nr:carboxylate-amine ligase [Ginsengibacter hankyongi]KAA9038202.1 carboxylate-amine ligase [Ginsengibacter hankyongi]